MNKKIIVYLLLMLLSLGIYYYYQNSNEELVVNEPIDLSHQPLYQSSEMMSIFYDPSGKPRYKIVALQVEFFDERKETLFQSPNITLYDENGEAKWHIQSNNARLTHDKLLYLNDNVQLNNLLPDIQLQTIRTQKAKVDLVTQIVTSDDEVIIQGANFTSHGTGLLGNLREKTAKILKNVTSYYGSSLPNTDPKTTQKDSE